MKPPACVTRFSRPLQARQRCIRKPIFPDVSMCPADLGLGLAVGSRTAWLDKPLTKA